MKKKGMFKMVVVFFVLFAFVVGPMAVSAADKKPLTRKMILGGRLGDPWFVLSQALANFVNKQSDWLRLEVVATPGASAGAEIARKDYEKYIFISPFYGMKFNPKDKRLDYYDKERIIGLCSANVHIWITYDKDLKACEDIAGKRVLIGRPGGARTVMEQKILEECGVVGKVRLMHGGFGAGRNALRDGRRSFADSEAMERRLGALPVSPPSPEQEVLRLELRGQIMRAFGELPAGRREVVVLRDIEGLSYPEIAEVVDATEGAVRVRVHRAREQLRELLAPYLSDG